MVQAKAVLITQCLQNDFVRPISKYDPLPNRLHIGYQESRRLLGDNPPAGPIAHIMEWAYQQSPDELQIIHIADRHSLTDPAQRAHLAQFGPHCLEGQEGAAFAFATPDEARPNVFQVHSPTLNDFHETDLAERLASYSNESLPVGVIGVWTEAKVYFLCYELASRYPKMRLAVCSALAASSSRAQHFLALDQLSRILGVRICDSVGEFIEFLGGTASEYPLSGVSASSPTLSIDAPYTLTETDELLMRYLFRNCRSVKARALDGGFSGNVVLGAKSVDVHGHEEAVHVVKIGERNSIGQERASFERIEEVLGNSAPRISDFADYGNRGAVKYRYASMGGTSATTFQKAYMAGMPLEKVEAILNTVFVEQLGKLYAAAELESCNLLEYYFFDSRWAASVRKKVEAILGRSAAGERLDLACGRSVRNLCLFYERELELVDSLRRDTAYFSYIHGDLNGANIILDGHENVWLIDFFHTHRGHVLKDLIKFENDLLFIFTPLKNSAELAEAVQITDLLVSVHDLSAELPPPLEVSLPHLQRAYDTIIILRKFYPALVKSDRSHLQWLIGALRYAVHTLAFDESSELQKEWALYAGSRYAEAISLVLSAQKTLRLDAIDSRYTQGGVLSVTILPGRKDLRRDLSEDLRVLEKHRVTHILVLVSEVELAAFGVGQLLEEYRRLGLEVKHLPILDQKVCSVDEMRGAISWAEQALAKGKHVLAHCTGGLGRSGLFAACFLKGQGLSADDAIEEVRRARSVRAVENPLQEDFIRQFTRA